MPKHRSTVAFLSYSLYRRRGGGEIVAWSTPEDIVKAPRSYTGKFLEPVLKKVRQAEAKGQERGGGVVIPDVVHVRG